MAWIDEANWPVAWTAIHFSPIVKRGSEYIVYASGMGVTKLYEYNLTTQTWTELSDPPSQFVGAASLSPDGTKLAWKPGNAYLYIYNIAGNSWTTSTIAPVLDVTGEAALIQTTVWTDNDTIWCHIRDASAHNRNKCYKYVVSSDTWTQYTNVYTLGPYNNSTGMTVNSAGTALYVGKCHSGSDRFYGFKYVIATDTYTQIAISNTDDYLMASDRSARLWTIDRLTTYTGNSYYDCDTETMSAAIFPNDPERTKLSQNLPCGIYDLTYIIAWNKTIEPKNRSYLSIVSPSVTTDAATAVGATEADLNGTLDADGGDACDCGFEWGLTMAYGNTTPTQSRTTGQTFAQTISVDPGKTYHFRAFATNAAGTSDGADRTFSTPLGLPTITTDPATGRGAIAATINATLNQDGGEACECGFEWGLDTGYGTTTPPQSKTTGETFSEVIGGLVQNTTYHFRAFATNSVGTGYGADRTFSTSLIISKGYALGREEL